MEELLSAWLSSSQAADALDGFLTERAAAMQHLSSELTTDGCDSDDVLDGALGASCTDEPWATVVSAVDCLEVGLRADIVEQHPQLVEQLSADLTDRDGFASVHRYGPAAPVVDARGGDELRLQMGLTLWLQRHLPR